MSIIPRSARAVYPTRTPKTILTANGGAKPISIFHRGRTIIIGQVIGDTFTKRVQASKHFLRTPKAICLDAQTIIDAEQAGATLVTITDTESGRVYRANLELFKAKSFPVKRGDGNQFGLTLNYWSVNGQQSEIERQEQAAAIKAEAASYEQPALFDLGGKLGAYR